MSEWGFAESESARATRVGRLARVTLRARLVAIPTVIVVAGLVMAGLFVVGGARARIDAEMRSGLRLAHLLVADTLAEIDDGADAGMSIAALTRDAERLRHIRLSAESDVAPPLPKPRHAPGWFARWIAPAPLSEVMRARRHPEAAILMRASSADEIDEIWAEMVTLAVLLASVGVVTGVTVSLVVRAGLRPLTRIAAALDEVEEGARGAVPEEGAPELRALARRLNAMIAALRRADSDRRDLINRLMSVQDEERAEIASELHDEIGPPLFALRTDVTCLRRALACHEHPAALLRADAIEVLAGGLAETTSRMLNRLRPAVLEEMGLGQALRALVQDWRERYCDIDVALDLDDGIAADEEVALTIYRMVQECLTNVARHAAASAVTVSIRRAGATIEIEVADNGRGMPPGRRLGHGLLGMTERLRRVGAGLATTAVPGGGTRVTATVPAGARSRVHA